MRSNHARARPAASHSHLSRDLIRESQLEVKFKKEPRSPNFAYVNKVDNQSTPPPPSTPPLIPLTTKKLVQRLQTCPKVRWHTNRAEVSPSN